MSEDRIIALATITQDGSGLRGKIPVPVVKALKAKQGDVLAFEHLPDGTIVLRKSTASERKVRSGGTGRAIKK